MVLIKAEIERQRALIERAKKIIQEQVDSHVKLWFVTEDEQWRKDAELSGNSGTLREDAGGVADAEKA